MRVCCHYLLGNGVDVETAVVPFFFADTAPTEIYTLSLHDALPITGEPRAGAVARLDLLDRPLSGISTRSEEHTSELQSLAYLVWRLLLEKKKRKVQKGKHRKKKKVCREAKGTDEDN